MLDRRKFVPAVIVGLFGSALAQMSAKEEMLDSANQFAGCYNVWAKIMQKVPEDTLSINEMRAWNQLEKAFSELKRTRKWKMA